MSKGGGCRKASQRRRDVPSGFRYAKHSDEPKTERGYLEKASAKDLDSKTANAGSNNFTKYARDLYPALQGQPWCDCREASQRRAVPSGFRYAKHSDEPKAENTRGEALLFSWSHPMSLS